MGCMQDFGDLTNIPHGWSTMHHICMCFEGRIHVLECFVSEAHMCVC